MLFKDFCCRRFSISMLYVLLSFAYFILRRITSFKQQNLQSSYQKIAQKKFSIVIYFLI